jgi:starch synthase
MISAAVEPHVDAFKSDSREPLPPSLAPTVKAPGAQRQHNPNKRKVLFVTSEIADLVKTGGLGDVSAALPRALAHLHDVRVLIPGYPQVMESDNPIHIVGELGGHAALPPCKIGRMDMADGLVIYVLICPELYQREGTPTAPTTAATGRTTISASPAWAWPPPKSPPVKAWPTGAPTWCTPTTGRPAWPRPTCTGAG